MDSTAKASLLLHKDYTYGGVRGPFALVANAEIEVLKFSCFLFFGVSQHLKNAVGYWA
jgi:hypothetical protein